jgi:hypothetical protein
MRYALILSWVVLSGCAIQERPEVLPVISDQKKTIGGMIVDRMEKRVKELVEEQTRLTVVIDHIKGNLQSTDEWIRAGNEVDPKEVYRF